MVAFCQPTGTCKNCGTDAVLDAEGICVECFFKEWDDNPAYSAPSDEDK